MKVASQESLFLKPGPMSLLLLIQSLDDVRSAIEQAGECLLFRRRQFAQASESDEILNALLGEITSEGVIHPGAFFPVLEATEPFDSIHATARELRVQHPHVIAGTWFVDDRERGILGPRDRQ